MIERCYGCMEEYDSSYGLCPNCGYEPETDVDSPIHMQPGVTLHGRYLIGKVLGFGGFGVTYIGWDFTLQQKVAIKEYLPSEFATRMIGQTQVTVFGGKKEEQFDDGMDQFVEEARRLAQFQNENGIVRIYDSFAENNTAYIVMEYLEGETLTAYLNRNGKVPVDDAISMLTPVLNSLETIHKAGIIHRDIAPDNIFLTGDGQVKLIDFGAARYATTSHSRSLTVIIKPGYSPEEQYRSRGDQGPHTDIYALAAVLYRMITGLVLPDSMERRANFENHGKDIVTPPSKYCKISQNQENAILNALNVRVEDRTASATQFLAELSGTKNVKRIRGQIKMLSVTRWPLWAKILIPVSGVAVLAVLVLLLTGKVGPQGNLVADFVLNEGEARVPSVVNYSVDVAQDRMLDENLQCRIIGAEYSDVIPANMVIHQTVLAGQVVSADSMVDVYISVDQGGPATEAGMMPYVVYKPESEAGDLLETLGVKVKKEYGYSDIVAEGLVMEQSLPSGMDISKGGTVTLEVSKGEDPNKREPSSELVVLSREKYGLYVGDSVTLKPRGGSGSYSYQSSDKNVVTVNRNGEVEAVGFGSATITVSSGDAEEAVCNFVVQDYALTITPESLTLFAEATANLTVSGVPVNAEIAWSSGNDSVATVNANGTVTGIATGETTITAVWKNGKQTYTAEIPVQVEAHGIALNMYKIGSFYVGETRTIVAETSPANQQVTWTSSNSNVAKVNSNGVVTAVGGGTAVITASFDNLSESCTVTVTQPSIALVKNSVSLYIGDAASLSAAVTPSSAAVTWSSDNSSVAQVSGGKVTAVGAGQTTIRARMTIAGIAYESVCTVIVTQPSVAVSKGSVGLMPGDTVSLTASTNPGGLAVTWTSSNSGVATVNNGKVTAVSNGTANIVATISYGGKTYKSGCAVTVANPSITISSDSNVITFSEIDNGICTLTANVTPDGGNVEWSSSNATVAPVRGNGKTATVTAKSEGSATITATYTVKGTTVKDSCTITVQKAPSTLRVSNISYPSRSSLDAFTFYAEVTSNYQILSLYVSGTAISNATGIPVSDSATFTLPSGTYQTGAAEASAITEFLRARYRTLYNLYGNVAGLLGADDSLTIVINATFTDSSGQTYGFTINYILDE